MSEDKPTAYEQLDHTQKHRLDTLFCYHSPTPEQVVSYARINDAAKAFAAVVMVEAANGADKSAAMRLIREARMTANASIACGGVS